MNRPAIAHIPARPGLVPAGAEALLLGFLLAGRAADADLGRQVHEQVREQLGDHHPLTLKIARRHQQLLRRDGRTGEAIDVCRARLASYQQRNMVEHSIGALLDLAEALHEHGRCAGAAPRSVPPALDGPALPDGIMPIGVGSR